MSLSKDDFIEISDRYEIIEELGSGGAGVVYRAHDSSLDIDVAIKVLKSETSAKGAIKFQKEAKASARMNHDNVVKVLDFGQTPKSGLLYLVEEYVSGKALSELIEEDRNLSLETVLELFIQISKGVEHAHDNGILHRDLKPSNVLLGFNDDGGMVAKISDFGLAKILDDDGSSTLTTVAGSPYYMSPEQIDNNSVDERSDIYSLGCIFYEVLAGRVPYAGSTVLDTFSQHKTRSYPSLQMAPVKIESNSEVDTLIEKCLHKDANERFDQVSSLIAELTNIYNKIQEAKLEALKAQRASEPSQAKFLTYLGLSSKDKKTPWLVTCISILIGIVVTVSLFLTYQKKEQISAKERKKAEAAVQSLNPLLKKDRDMTIGLGTDFISSVKDAPVHFVRKPAEGKNWLYNLAKNITDEDLKVLENEKDVRFIWFTQSNVTGTGCKYLLGKNVLSLNLINSPVTDEGLKTICQLGTLDHLSLRFGTKFTGAGLKEVAKLKHLAYFYISSPDISNQDMIALLPKLKSLENLSMYGMGQISSQILPTVTKLKNLKYLNIGDTGIDAKSLASLSKLKKLKYLDLSKLKLTDSDLKVVSKLKLETLVLTDNPLITVDGISVLKKMPTLRYLYLVRCFGINKHGLFQFMKDMPRVKFELVHETREKTFASVDKMMGSLEEILKHNLK